MLRSRTGQGFFPVKVVQNIKNSMEENEIDILQISLVNSKGAILHYTHYHCLEIESQKINSQLMFHFHNIVR